MKLSDFFQNAGTKNIVINTDIDGFLSGMILQKYYGCKVVGFSNSRDSIWLVPEITNIYEPVYIDIFVNNERTYCIDQHIVAYDEAHFNRIRKYGSKLNPNLTIKKRTYIDKDEFKNKYPFGTVHYLIALMKLDGIDVEFNPIEINHTITGKDGFDYKICPAQVILRADDALFSTLGPYKSNASEWWKELLNYKSNTITVLHTYLEKLEKIYDEEKNKENKEYIGKFFKSGLGCDGKDGAFTRVTELGKDALLEKVKTYNAIVNQIIGIKMDLPEKVIEHKGSALVELYSEEALNKAITYAFIYGPTNSEKKCFSYTVELK